MTTSGSSTSRRPANYGKTFGPGRANVIAAIRALTDVNGYPPTVREIGDAAGMAISTVHGHLMRMERDGVLTSTEGRNRTWRLL